MAKPRSSKRARRGQPSHDLTGASQSDRCSARTRNAKKQESQEKAQALSSIIPHLVQNGWIGGSCLCRLEEVSPHVKCDDDVWKALCCINWPSTAYIEDPIVRAFGGYRVLFRHRAATILPPKKPEALPPPTLNPIQFGILIDIFVADQNVHSTIFNGKDFLDDIQENGRAFFVSREPFVLGNARCWMSDSEECSCEPQCRFSAQRDSYKARMHFLRTDAFTSCCICDPKDIPRWSRKGGRFDLIGDPKDGLYDWRAEDTWAAFCPSTSNEPSIALRQTATAAEVLRRLPKHFYFGFALNVGVIKPGEKVGIKGYQIDALVEDDKGDIDYFDDALQKKTGVTLLHVFDQMQCIDDVPT